MNLYTQRWLLAVALKQPYPSETGATTDPNYNEWGVIRTPNGGFWYGPTYDYGTRTRQELADTRKNAIMLAFGVALGVGAVALIAAPKAST